MPFFEQLHYEYDPIDQKPTVLFLHGFLGSLADWKPVAAEITDSFGRLAVDLPGHGGSHTTDRKTFSFSVLAPKVVRLLDSLALEKVHLIGYSMGGRLALYLLTHYADRFDRVVIESASPGLETEQERQARMAHDLILADKLRATPLKQWLTDWYAQPIFESLAKRTDLLAHAISTKLEQNAASLADALELMSVGYQENLWPRLASIEKPLLLIAGEFDAKYTEIAHKTARLCPHGRAVIIEQAGHNIHLEQPEQYIRQLKTYLSEQA